MLWRPAVLSLVLVGAACVGIGALLFYVDRQNAQIPLVLQDQALTPPAPADGVLKITAFGTSLTAEPQTWPADLEHILGHCLETPVTVHRVAGPGMGSRWALEQLHQVIEAQPDLILLEFSINDADVRDGVTLAQSRAQHETLVTKIRHALPQTEIWLMTMSPAHGMRGWMRPRLQEYYALYEALAQEFELGLIDHYARWRALPRQARGLAQDGLHPDSTVATQVILPSLYAALAPPNCELPS